MQRCIVVALAVLVALALAAAPALGAGGRAMPVDYDWEEVTYRHGKVVSVRRGRESQQPYRATFDKRRATIVATSAGGRGAPRVRPAVRGLAEVSEEDYGNCKTVRVAETGRSAVYYNVMYRFWLTNFFCWSYPAIVTYHAGDYYTDVDSAIHVRPNIASFGYYYTWRGHPHGGHFALREGYVENCLPDWFFGGPCTGRQYPRVQIWLNGNGAWAAQGSGGGYWWD